MPESTRPAASAPIAALGAWILSLLEAFGRFSRFCGAVLAGFLTPRPWTRSDRLGRQLFFVGTTSVPVLMVTGGFIGMVLAIEGYWQFAAVGQEGRLGGVINVSLAKQIGPVLAAVILAGRVGCSLTAELGSMRVTEQLDAMQAMGADPVRVLACPRVISCVLMCPVLTSVSNFCGVVGGWVICTRFYDVDRIEYWHYSELFMDYFDIVNGLTKSVLFGLAIGLIACYKGFTCRPGAEGVGRATTESFVTSFMVIIMMNLVMAKALNDIDVMRTGGNFEKMLG